MKQDIADNVKILGIAKLGSPNFGSRAAPPYTQPHIYYGLLTHTIEGKKLAKSIPVIILFKFGEIVRIVSNSITGKVLYENS